MEAMNRTLDMDADHFEALRENVQRTQAAYVAACRNPAAAGTAVEAAQAAYEAAYYAVAAAAVRSIEET